MFRRANRIRVSFSCGEQEVTKQSHKAECDINNILRQYQRTGIMTHVQNARPTYGDLPSNVDFQQAMNTILEAEAAFLALPSKVRAHFENDPERFLASFGDPKQADDLRRFGLLPEIAAVAGAEAPPAASEG